MQLILESIFVGIVFGIFDIIFSYIFSHMYNPDFKINQDIYWKESILSGILSGFILNILFTYFGLNKFYCRKMENI